VDNTENCNQGSRDQHTQYTKGAYEFFYFTAGTGRVVLSGREQKLYPGATVIVQPHITHTFMNDSAEVPLEAVLVKINSLPEDTYPT
jgi:mannose-6-phosphate isomerase-like protein (cupin superfamily)